MADRHDFEIGITPQWFQQIVMKFGTAMMMHLDSLKPSGEQKFDKNQDGREPMPGQVCQCFDIAYYLLWRRC